MKKKYQTRGQVRTAARGGKVTSIKSSIRHWKEMRSATPEEMWNNELLRPCSKNCALCQRYMEGEAGECSKCILAKAGHECSEGIIYEAIAAFDEVLASHFYNEQGQKKKSRDLNVFRKKCGEVIKILKSLL